MKFVVVLVIPDLAEAPQRQPGSCVRKQRTRDAGLSRGAVLRLAKMKVKTQQKVAYELLEKSKLPRRVAPKRRATITLPTKPKSLAEKLFQGLGQKESSEVLEALTKLLEEHGKKE